MTPTDHMLKADRALASARLLLTDYTGEKIDDEAAEWVIAHASAFVEAVRYHLSPSE